VRASWSIAFVLGACIAGPRPPPAPPRQTSLGLELSDLKLSNGLRVLIVHDRSAAEVQVTMRYRVGSVDEPAGQAGVAHLVEHMMYQQVLGGSSLFARLESATTFFNGWTSFDATTYTARAAPSRLDELLSIEAVRVGFRCTSITDSAFAREREVVINELRQRDYASELLGALHRGLYPEGHPYRAWVAGSEASVAAITREQACAFADAHYAPGNAVLVVSGDVTVERVEAALHKFLTRVASRAAVAPVVVPPLAGNGRRLTAPAPIDDDAVLVAWPLPSDPLLRARVRAVMPAVSAIVDGKIRGRVLERSLGDDRAPAVGLIIVPATNETVVDVLRAAQQALDGLPSGFERLHGSLGELAFDAIQQDAIYHLFAKLEDGSKRDPELASYLLEGRDPKAALAGEFNGLRQMTRTDAAAIIRDQLAFARAIIVELKASGGKKRGHDVHVDAAIHDLGLRRDPPDPEDAHRPAREVSAHPINMRTRRLPNGLNVVLLPATTVPTIDVRLVFASGSADEPSDKRGAALVAAHALTWDLHYLDDLLRFAAAGGETTVDVGFDHTTFAARGLDMHLDLLLAGLRRLVRDGHYTRGARVVVEAMRRQTGKLDDYGAATDAWRGGMYGASHPYVAAGRREASPNLAVADAKRFRAAHYTPDNATLVIAGHFDAALADRWIDYLFSDWTGSAEPRSAPATNPRPASIARAADTSQIGLNVALPATAGGLARKLIAGEMLDELASDVRHQLGASYGLHAALDESRLATTYVLSGWVDAPRCKEAVELLRARLERLRSDPDAAARAFAAARDRVLVKLVGRGASAAALAEQVEHDVDLARAPMSDVETARTVQMLTIDQMAATLADLDLAHAVVSMVGPTDDVDRAFAVLGRKPTYVHVDQAALDNLDAPIDAAPPAAPREPEDDRDDERSIGETTALTEQAPSSRLALTVAPSYAAGSIADHDASGFAISANVGYRVEQRTAVGLHLATGGLSGSYIDGATPHSFTTIPIEVAAFAQATALDRLWGAAFIGVHAHRTTDTGPMTMVSWSAGLGAGLQAGVDVIRRPPHRIGVVVDLHTLFGPAAGYTAYTVGIAYRR
jgi:zinc protease